MKIFFIGTVKFSELALYKLIELGENVVGVACKEKSKFNEDFSDLGEICRANNVDFKYVRDINSSDVFNWINSLKPDIIFCFGWSNLIQSRLLDLPPLGVVGFHPAKLPMNRGRHPIIWALFLGLNITASTFFFIDESADNGDILSQVEVDISENDNAYSLYNKITSTALKQIEEFLPKLKTNNFKRISQDNDKANNWRKRNKKDGEIDWRMSAKAIYNLTRALTKPYVGAHFLYKEKEIKVWEVRIVSEEYSNIINIEPGKVIKIDKKLKTFDVKCFEGVIRLISHELKFLPNLGDYLL